MSSRTYFPWNRAGYVPQPSTAPLSVLQNELSRAFEGFLDGSNFFETNSSAFQPRLDFSETETEYQVVVELPGFSEADVDLELVEKSLKIRGEKKDSREGQSYQFLHQERRFGAFERTVTLPKPVQRDAITAIFKNGELKVTLPKFVPAETQQKIEVLPG